MLLGDDLCMLDLSYNTVVCSDTVVASPGVQKSPHWLPLSLVLQRSEGDIQYEVAAYIHELLWNLMLSSLRLH